MKATDFSQPELLLKVFAEDGTRNTLPVVNTDTSNPQKADLTNGFPVETEGSPDDGKLPPERADFNALGYLTTSYDFFYQAGGVYTFNATVSTAIGGYPKGARLWYQNSDGVSMILRSTKDDNTDNFNTDSSYIGTSWVVESFAGISSPAVKLFDYKFSDSEIHNMSWVKSDNSWLLNTTYALAYQHLVDDVGFLPVNDNGTVKIQVSCSAYTAGNYTRSSADDKVISNITYYAWKYSTDILYVTLNTGSMSADDAVDALQGQQIYKFADSSMSMTIHKITAMATDSYSVSGSTVDLNVLVGSDGHRVILVTNNENEDVDDVYNEIGVAWYYVLDKTNTRFKLPRTKYSFDGYRGTVGGYIEAGLPDFGGELGSINGHGFVANGIFKHTAAYVTNPGGGTGDWHNVEAKGSYSNEIYGNSNTVQPPATEMYLYFYVGDFSNTAIAQTAGITADTINAKMDADASNATTAGKATVVGWGVPDYDAGVTISTPFTPTKDGIVTLKCTRGTVQMTISYNGNRIARHQSGDGTEVSNTIWAVVHKGEEYEITTNGGTVERIFYPFIGG